MAKQPLSEDTDVFVLYLPGVGYGYSLFQFHAIYTTLENMQDAANYRLRPNCIYMFVHRKFGEIAGLPPELSFPLEPYSDVPDYFMYGSTPERKEVLELMQDTNLGKFDTIWVVYLQSAVYDDWQAMGFFRSKEDAHNRGSVHLSTGDIYAILETTVGRLLDLPMVFANINGEPPTDLTYYKVPPVPFAPGDMPESEV